MPVVHCFSLTHFPQNQLKNQLKIHFLSPPNPQIHESFFCSSLGPLLIITTASSKLSPLLLRSVRAPLLLRYPQPPKILLLFTTSTDLLAATTKSTNPPPNQQIHTSRRTNPQIPWLHLHLQPLASFSIDLGDHALSSTASWTCLRLLHSAGHVFSSSRAPTFPSSEHARATIFRSGLLLLAGALLLSVAAGQIGSISRADPASFSSAAKLWASLGAPLFLHRRHNRRHHSLLHCRPRSSRQTWPSPAPCTSSSSSTYSLHGSVSLSRSAPPHLDGDTTSSCTAPSPCRRISSSAPPRHLHQLSTDC